LTDGDKTDADQRRHKTQPLTPVERGSELKRAQTETGEQQSHRPIQSKYKGFKRWLYILSKDFRLKFYRIRFVLELAGFVVITFYTCQAYRGNQLTRTLVHGTVAPLIVCSVNAQRVVSRELTVEVVCPNTGQTIADDVTGIMNIIVESLPDGSVLSQNAYKFGGKGVIIRAHEPTATKWTFPLAGFDEPTEMPRIIKWQEIIVADGSVNYADGLGGTVSRPFCQIYANYSILFPDYTEGFHDGSCDEMLPRLRTALKHKQDDEQKQK
jgi:hypothetical protein